MQGGVMPLLGAWANFHVIVGSAGAALTGLQFVVIALIAESRRKSTPESIDAFGTPTIVHFCAVLLVSAVLSAPWRALATLTMLLGGIGVAGMAYIGVVTRRASRQTHYHPVLEDWIWHMVLPCLAYATVLCSAVALAHHDAALFAIGGANLLLLFIGIHNAWDTVTYVAVEGSNTDATGG